MILRRLKADMQNFEELYGMVSAMNEMLESSPKSKLTLDELLMFQDVDGSFKLFDTYEVPGDARVDFCYMPTYYGTAILMKEYLIDKRYIVSELERALEASLKCGFLGHGYEAQKERIDAIKIFIKGGLRKLLETEREICPEFQNAVNNIVHRYNFYLMCRGNNAKDLLNEDHSSAWQEIVDQLKLNKRLYVAYGSNMNKSQMSRRCPGAKVLGKTYLENWTLTLPHYANIERYNGKKTPALVWEITSENEVALDRYEGYPDCYDKLDIIVSVDGKRMTAMAYVMTDKYKKRHKKPRSEYINQILQGYRDAGFDETEFQPGENYMLV
ncbi:MAG: gamma-glutamylcyclotransferase [Clostridiaceae bacterium]|nr:gamma-glutamylcyclotransferase [Clostridiaceae bacterium]